ncbi:MAG TPA: hypothetical protein VH437_03445 [Terriglobales bacterium]|jgi:hypothetical protein
MRSMAVVLSIIVCCGMAAAQWQGQATVIGGYASNWVAPSYTIVPFVPLVKTPSVSLDPGFTGAVGAQNATEGLAAGARSSTLEIGHQEAFTMSNQPPANAGNARVLDLGSAMSQYSMGIAAQVHASAARGTGARTITNQDVDRLNQGTGVVKYRGKTEEVH